MSMENQIRLAMEAVKNEALTVGDTAYAELVLNVPVNKVPEDAFVNYFLPRFAGVIKDHENWIIRWIAIAGSPVAEVDIINPITKEVLFRVPPIVDTNIINPHNTDNEIHAIFSRSQQLDGNLAGTGFNYLVQALGNKAGQYAGDLSISKRRWLEIFYRYGYIKEPTKVEAASDELFQY